MRIRRAFPLLLAAAAIVVVAGGGALAALETDTVESFGEGVWWAVSLMTTVGFAGETPHTAAGKILSAVLMVVGFALIAATTAAIASFFVHEDEAPAEERILAELAAIRERLDALERRDRAG